MNNIRKYKELLAIAAAIVIIGCTAVLSFAADPVTPDTVDTITNGITTMYNSVASNFSFTNIVTFLGVAIGGCALLALGWFGLRKVIYMIQEAVRKGRVRP